MVLYSFIFTYLAIELLRHRAFNHEVTIPRQCITEVSKLIAYKARVDYTRFFMSCIK